jgi:hypothetical protein
VKTARNLCRRGKGLSKGEGAGAGPRTGVPLTANGANASYRPTGLNSDKGSTRSVLIMSLRDQLVGPVRRVLAVLLVATGFVLLIACGNVANVLVSRDLDRWREASVRLAIGATTWHLARESLLECLLLAVGSATLGLTLSAGMGSVVGALGSATVPALADVRINLRVASFALGVSLLASLSSVALPLLRSAWIQSHGRLADGLSNSIVLVPLGRVPVEGGRGWRGSENGRSVNRERR